MDFKEKKIIIRGNRTSYIDEGSPDSTALIFIHGFPFNKEMWNDQLTAFRNDFRVIAYDVRGHGHSDIGPFQFSILQFAQDLLLFMDALAVDKAILCGLSMGGYIALHILELEPERIMGLILCDTTCDDDTAAIRQKRTKAIATVRLKGLRNFAEESLQNFFSEESLKTKENEVSYIRDSILSTSIDTVCKTLLALANRREMCSVLGNLKSSPPSLIVVGEMDRITPVEAAKKTHELLPGSTLEIINNAGHISNLENPEQFNDCLKKFLENFKD